MLAGLLMVGYIAYDINMIQKQETFIGAQDDKVQRNMIFLFGFKLLVDLVGLI